MKLLVSIPESGPPEVQHVIPYGHDRQPRTREVCPVDGESLSRVGVTKLAYTWETCRCGEPEYPHLVEQLWHREHVGAPLESAA